MSPYGMEIGATGGAMALRPTAVHSLAPWARPRSAGISSGKRLYFKRDGACHPQFGGNKARKLAVLFDHARRLGKEHLVVSGHGASHTVLAACLLGPSSGFTVKACLTPFPTTEYSKGILAAIQQSGAAVYEMPTWKGWVQKIFPKWGWEKGGLFTVPTGASNGRTLGAFHGAVSELAKGIRSGTMPPPDAVVVPLASGGTALGLAWSLAETGLHAKVLAVPVAGGGVRPHLNLLAQWMPFLFRHPVRALGALRRIHLLAGYRGEGYGLPSGLGTWAAGKVSSRALFVDPIYGAKACAAALHQVHLGRYPTVLFWQTGPAENPARVVQSRNPAPQRAHSRSRRSQRESAGSPSARNGSRPHGVRL